MPAVSSTIMTPASAMPACAGPPHPCAALRRRNMRAMKPSWTARSAWISCSTPSCSPRAASPFSTAAMRSARKTTTPTTRIPSNGRTAATCTAEIWTGMKSPSATIRRPAPAGSSTPSASWKRSAPPMTSLRTKPIHGSSSPTTTTSSESAAISKARSSSPSSISVTATRQPGSTRQRTITT